MAENTKIEWTDHTVNLWWGCTKVHAGCDNCYAEELSDNMKRGTFNIDQDKLWGEGVPRKKVKSAFTNLRKFQKIAEKENTFQTVFVGSMMDIFEKSKPLIDHKGEVMVEKTGDLRSILFAQITKGDYPNLIFLFLTKRPSNILKMIPDSWLGNPPKNVWFGCSPVDQKTYNNFNAHMLNVRGNKFYSIEPQLGVIEISPFDNVDWIIQGGESGKNRRGFDLEWAKYMKDQCELLGIKYFFKQIDKVRKIPEEYLIRQLPDFKKVIYELI